MLDMLSGAGAAPHACIWVLGMVHGGGYVLILAHEGALDVRIGVGSKGLGHGVVDGALWHRVGIGGVGGQDGRYILVWEGVWSDGVVLGRYVGVGGVVSRHGAGCGEGRLGG